MTRPLRAALLILVLLLQGLGNAWALPPLLQLAEPEQAEMPCHDDAGAQDKMPCCGDDLDCHCSTACFGAGGALAPALAGFGEAPGSAPLLVANSCGLLPAHVLLLLRPPASS